MAKGRKEREIEREREERVEVGGCNVGARETADSGAQSVRERAFIAVCVCVCEREAEREREQSSTSVLWTVDAACLAPVSLASLYACLDHNVSDARQMHRRERQRQREREQHSHFLP